MDRDSTSIDRFFSDYPASRPIFDRVQALVAEIGPAEVRVMKIQIGFRRCYAFAWAWIPEGYLRGDGPPLMLSMPLPHQDPSPRWNKVVHPAPGHFMHHLELYSPDEVDAEVRAWLVQAWDAAG